ncbi:DUF3099 domain-containing protein [Gordonia sp. DT30]|uniref:DUF3099 domain-containing protein n=1 Tax=unclassified Gordonia (in: high G+C Gram-positive bacteria) TaxID=2657482 RepID=UPI003CF57E80
MAERDESEQQSGSGRGKADAFLITGAPTPYDEQHRARVHKYLALMAFRVPALIIAGIVYSSTGSGWWALGIIAASIPLPWIAVLIANDRPPRKRGEVRHYLYGAEHHVVGPQPLGSSAKTGIVESTPTDIPRGS